MSEAIEQDTGALADLVERARGLLVRPGRTVLGIAGSPGSGKSTLAERLVAELGGTGPDAAVAHVPMDGFHLADVELTRLGRLDSKGAPDTFDADGYAALLERLVAETDHVIWAPGFERVLEQPLAGSVPVHPSARLVVTEGNYLLLADGAWPRARAAIDEVWFCDADEQRRLGQLVARHVAFGKSPDAARTWSHGTDQRNADLVRASAGAADLLVPDGALAALEP